MAKFLNKKEQVIDFKLTDYGHYLLSIGTFKPVYYGFFDDNILYDGEYAGVKGASGRQEGQNSIHERLKEETPYIESLTLFSNIDYALQTVQSQSRPDDPAALTGRFFAGNMDPTLNEPRPENFRFTSMIGDAAMEGNPRYAPAWKVITLQGEISSSVPTDTKNDIRVPQINIDVNYTLKAVDETMEFFPENVRQFTDRIIGFVDKKMIKLEMQDALIYSEEQNTELFTENFDMEIFKIVTGTPIDTFERKYFPRVQNQIVDGLLKLDTVERKLPIGPAGVEYVPEPSEEEVEHYFTILTDHNIEEKIACKATELFNKSSYYIDLDFDCEIEEGEDLAFADIYGKVTESEICPS